MLLFFHEVLLGVSQPEFVKYSTNHPRNAHAGTENKPYIIPCWIVSCAKSRGDETNLIDILGVVALATKVSNFLLTTGELMQFRHFNENQIDDDSEEALREHD